MNTTENAPAEERGEIVLRPHFHSTEDANGATLRIAFPGVRKEDLKLTLRESNLSIEARRGDEVPEGWKTQSDTGRSDRYELNIRSPAVLTVPRRKPNSMPASSPASPPSQGSQTSPDRGELIVPPNSNPIIHFIYRSKNWIARFTASAGNRNAATCPRFLIQ